MFKSIMNYTTTKQKILPLIVNTGAKKFINRYGSTGVNTNQEHTLPRRALMYVPGHDDRKIKKAFGLDVDCIALDCEDGVAENRKADARKNIHNILNDGKPKKIRDYDFGVRLNSVDTEYFQADLQSALSAKNLPDTLLLPKVNSVENMRLFTDELKKCKKAEDHVNLIIFIESCKAVLNLVEICKSVVDFGEKNNFTPVSMVFGGDDYLADVGATKSDDCIELLYARQKFIAAAKAYGMQAIDIVHIQFKELEALRLQSESGARMGFTGKQVIHPDQVPVVQKAFLPNEKQIEWANGVLTAFNEHEKIGKGAFTYRGSMIDMPTVKQARNIMNLYKMSK